MERSERREVGRARDLHGDGIGPGLHPAVGAARPKHPSLDMRYRRQRPGIPMDYPHGRLVTPRHVANNGRLATRGGYSCRGRGYRVVTRQVRMPARRPEVALLRLRPRAVCARSCQAL